MFFCFYFVMVYRTERGVKGRCGVCLFFFPCFFTDSLCVFSSVYVVLSVVFYPLGFVICLLLFCFVSFISCTKHKHQWHVNHANQTECIPLLCPPADHTLSLLFTRRRVCFHFTCQIFFFGARLWFYFYNQSFGWIIKAWNGDKSKQLTGSFSGTHN